MTMIATALTVENGLARLRFTDAANANPINRRLCDELCDQAVELSSRGDVRAVLVTADGKHFGFGGDIAHFNQQGDQLPAEIKRMTATIHSAITRLQRMDAPMVVAVQGVCAGVRRLSRPAATWWSAPTMRVGSPPTPALATAPTPAPR